MTIKQTLFGFKGRLGRLSFFRYTVAALAVTALVMAGLTGLGYLIELQESGIAGANKSYAAQVVAGSLAAVWMVFLLWVSFALQAKRLHDMGRSGWHLVWINAISIVGQAFGQSQPIVANACALAGLAIALVFLFKKGEDFPNVYGRPPGKQAEMPPSPLQEGTSLTAKGKHLQASIAISLSSCTQAVSQHEAAGRAGAPGSPTPAPRP